MLKSSFRYWAHALTWVSCMAVLGSVYGQSSIASDHFVYAIVGARIEIGDGRILEKGTIVIRNGLITAIAADAAVPRGAEVLDGKGLTVYPGFIDAFATKPYTPPSLSQVTASDDPDTNIADYAPAFMRENGRRGIHPEERVTSHLNLNDAIVKPYQTAGFTTILVAPSGNDMSGSATLINLSGRPSRECVLLREAGTTISFGGQGWGQPYPSSLMGHIAQLRQTFLDARWFESVSRSFNLGGSQRPPNDDSLLALQPVMSGRLPAIFDADTEYQIERSLDLSDEFHIKPIIAGGTEAWKELGLLKQTSTPVLVSLAFTKDPSAPPSKDSTKSNATEPSEEVKEEKLNPLKLGEQVRLYKEKIGNTAAIARAGLLFAFTTKGSANPGEFMDHLRKTVEAGLSKEAALRALTIDAAKIFGIDRQLGTLEVGKIANISVFDGDFLKATTKLKMIYIDGRKIDPSKSPAAPAPKLPSGISEGN